MLGQGKDKETRIVMATAPKRPDAVKKQPTLFSKTWHMPSGNQTLSNTSINTMSGSITETWIVV